MHRCTQERVLNDIKEGIKEIKTDVRTLLKFKWQMYTGIAIVCFAITTFIACYGTFLIKK